MLINSYFVLLWYFVGYCRLRFLLRQVAENVNLYILLYGTQFIHIRILVNCYLKSWKNIKLHCRCSIKYGDYYYRQHSTMHTRWHYILHKCTFCYDNYTLPGFKEAMPITWT